MPGHPLVYATSKSFMDYFGINTPEELPKIKEVLADQIIEPATIHHTLFEEKSSLVVSDDGELVNEEKKDESENEDQFPENDKNERETEH